MEASMHTIKVHEDVSFAEPRAIVTLPWLHGNPSGKRRTTLIRKRAVVLRKHEQWVRFWASALTAVTAPPVLALGDAATEPAVIVSQGLVWGQRLETQTETLLKAKWGWVSRECPRFPFLFASDLSWWIDLVKQGHGSQMLSRCQNHLEL